MHVVSTKCPDPSDSFWKVRPLVDVIQARLFQLKPGEVVSIDEAMVPFKDNHWCKVYMKDKPKPWGWKLYMLADKFGLPYAFVLYDGKKTKISPGLIQKYGFCAAVVLHLVQRLDHEGHTVCFDNYFSTYNVFEVLHRLRLNAIGKS